MKNRHFYRKIKPMQDTVQEIKDKIDLVDFLRTYLSLSQAGKNFKAHCPFHKEKTPSFIVSPERQIWHCFGCGAHGDLIGFLMKYENLEFLEALKILAEKVGIELRRSGSQDQKQFVVLYEINQAAKDFFKNNLAKAEAARNYLLERGLKKEIIEEFEIGVAFSVSDALTQHLLKSGFSVADIEKAGLVFKTERGTYWDRFRNRIMFPLYNHFGKVIGFTGRVMPGFENADVGKYVNSPETPIFNKSKLLFGLHKTKNDIREAKTAVLIEGQMDFLMAYQDGVKNVVATSGTALTNDHLKIIKRLADNLILAFDNDEAGQMATERSIDLAEANDFSVKVLDFSKEGLKDPADIVKNKPGYLISLFGNAEPAMKFYFDRYLPKVNLHESDIHLQKKNIRSVLSKIKNISSPIVKSHWIHELALLVGLEERFLLEEMDNLKSAAINKKEEIENNDKQDLSRKELISQRIIGLALEKNNFAETLKDYQTYLPPSYQTVFATCINNEAAGLSPQLKDVLDLINLRAAMTYGGADEIKIEMEFYDLLKQLKHEYFKERKNALNKEIMEAEKKGDEERINKLLGEFKNVIEEHGKI